MFIYQHLARLNHPFYLLVILRSKTLPQGFKFSHERPGSCFIFSSHIAVSQCIFCFVFSSMPQYFYWCMVRQLQFSELKPALTHGGSLAIGKRKSARPIHTGKSMHLVLRSNHAIGKRSFLLHERRVRTLIQKQAKAFHVQVYALTLNTNHIHALIKTQTRQGFKSFLRTITGLIARYMMKGTNLSHFWTDKIYSRIVEWGRAFQTAKAYILQNELEAHSIIPYKKRKKTKQPNPPKQAKHSRHHPPK